MLMNLIVKAAKSHGKTLVNFSGSDIIYSSSL